MDHDAQLAAAYASVDALIDFAQARLDMDSRDTDWARNQLFAVFGGESYHGPGEAVERGRESSVDSLLESFRRVLAATGHRDNSESDAFADVIMGILTPRPSHIQNRFADMESTSGSMAAMQWFYTMSVDSSYVKRAQLESNPRFESHGLIITINRSKPEFKNMASAAAGNAVSGGYPQCSICHENEGFAGRNKRTLRTVPVELGGEPWFWQFSPYGYFDQHGICVNRQHTPMHVNRETFSKLLDFVDRFPGYFLGCNAALPRIGGSVLAHDHFQGGGGLLPMHTAKTWFTLRDPARSDVVVEILDWPGTAVRVVSRSREHVVEVCETIRQAWVGYSNVDAGIVGQDEDGVHSAVSPSVIVTERGYEMSLIFRNNAVSSRYPDGIFHAHPEFYAVKQEPIGLIEAQGLFILPGRLVEQLDLLEDALATGFSLPESLTEFGLVWKEVSHRMKGVRDRGVIRDALHDELGSICFRILENTAVFKSKDLTRQFLEACGFSGGRSFP